MYRCKIVYKEMPLFLFIKISGLQTGNLPIEVSEESKVASSKRLWKI